MHVLALVTQKGGTGKSSLAVSLAVAALERGLKVYIIDLDPQATARNWFERREAAQPEVATVEATRVSAAQIALQSLGFVLFILDVHDVDTAGTIAAMQP